MDDILLIYDFVFGDNLGWVLNLTKNDMYYTNWYIDVMGGVIEVGKCYDVSNLKMVS